MQMSGIPFGTTDWSTITPTEHPGETGQEGQPVGREGFRAVRKDTKDLPRTVHSGERQDRHRAVPPFEGFDGPSGIFPGAADIL